MEEINWIERAKSLVAYHDEALDFINRASQQLPTSPLHAQTLSRLWVEADHLDQMICSHLDEVNTQLLTDEGEMDTTRGATIRKSLLDEDTLFYECSWTLNWDGSRGMSVNLAIDAGTGIFEAQVYALQSGEAQGIRFPMSESSLKEGLTSAYVSEMTFRG